MSRKDGKIPVNNPSTEQRRRRIWTAR